MKARVALVGSPIVQYVEVIIGYLNLPVLLVCTARYRGVPAPKGLIAHERKTPPVRQRRFTGHEIRTNLSSNGSFAPAVSHHVSCFVRSYCRTL